ncbi:ATP-binding protein [Clostridium sp. VAP41]|uniref:ATP-binding protein n=1 Tax=Clostridium sp. VAP41 TaxID=2949979 RepID=UPI00257CC4FF|nr:ATP-binding protein [Clostridium sp. VAP41]
MSIYWTQKVKLFYAAVIASAILDRVLHHAKAVTINGKLYRLKNHFKQDED